MYNDASNFTDVFHTYKSNDLKWKRHFIDMMKMLMIDVEEIEETGAFDKWTIKLIYRDEQFVLADMSEGTIKALVLCMLLSINDKYDLLDTFTDRFKEEDSIAIIVFDGSGNAKRINYQEIKEDLGEWQLGDLYRVNDPSLGGWPW